MSDEEQRSLDDSELARVERALAETLRPRPLPPGAMERIRATVHTEWRMVTGSAATSDRPRVRWPVRVSLVAAVILVMLSAVFYWVPFGQPYAFGTVARSDLGAAELRVSFMSVQQLKAGDVLKTGTVLRTRGPTLIALTSGGTLRVAADTVLELSGQTVGVLRRGQIYVDLPPGIPTRTLFQIKTHAGNIEHLGTEFEVISNDRLVRVRVREGLVRFRSPSGDVNADAGTELTAVNGAAVSRSAISVYGRDWLWVAALAPDYDIEGRPLMGFLEWAGRELGRPVKFSDDHARAVAARTILHGSVRGRDPLDALSTVLATTSLTYEIRGDAIWIQSGRAN